MAVDLERREKVMARSQKLGHCICNPRHPCPCPTLIEQNVCPCAGERLPAKVGQVALTRHVRKAGCASKIGQGDLQRVLGALPAVTDPNVLLGTAAGDDAGVYRLDERLALVQTVDVFTPCVDDPFLFGQIAAANSVSDCYAMGARPLTALSIVGFPIETLDDRIMTEMLRGGMEKLDEAGCALIGGHSINDEEVKCGFAITGVVELGRFVARDRARPGDVLVLTKPLGTGMLCFAAQLGLASEACMAEVGAWMATLNRDAAELMGKYGAHACTDITGFGLAGHLVSMVRGSGVDAEIDLARVPVFALVQECIEQDVLGGAVDRNQAYAMSFVTVQDVLPRSGLPVLYDPQTSGGLLVSLPEPEAPKFVEELRARGHTAATAIGRIREKGAGHPEGRVIVTNTLLANFVGVREKLGRPPTDDPPENRQMERKNAPDACCDHSPDLQDVAPEEQSQGASLGTDSNETLGVFKEFMKAASLPGLIDAKHKKLIAVALAIAHHCHPCLAIHLQGAMRMGIAKTEIDEAANLAIAFGGCTSMMFYCEVCKEVGSD